MRRNFSQRQLSYQPPVQPFTSTQSQSSKQTLGDVQPAAAIISPHRRQDGEKLANSRTEDASGEKDVVSQPDSSSMPSKGNPKYGKCTVDGCTSFKIRKNFLSCWTHLPRYLPNEIKVSAAMQRAGLLEWIWPCDLVATVAHAKAALKLGLLPFTIISFLKIPGAISRFLTKLGSASAVNAEVLMSGLQAACAGCKNSATASLHSCLAFCILCFLSRVLNLEFRIFELE